MKTKSINHRNLRENECLAKKSLHLQSEEPSGVTALPLNCFQGLLGWKQNGSSFRDTFYFDYEGILDDNSASCDDGFLQLAKTI